MYSTIPTHKPLGIVDDLQETFCAQFFPYASQNVQRISMQLSIRYQHSTKKAIIHLYTLHSIYIAIWHM